MSAKELFMLSLKDGWNPHGDTLMKHVFFSDIPNSTWKACIEEFTGNIMETGISCEDFYKTEWRGREPWVKTGTMVFISNPLYITLRNIVKTN